MCLAFPQFDGPTALDEQRSWTARFESFDQHNDAVYYVIRLRERGDTRAFIGKVMYSGSPPDTSPDCPEVMSAIAEQLGAIAASGMTNTTYPGSPFGAR